MYLKFLGNFEGAIKTNDGGNTNTQWWTWKQRIEGKRKKNGGMRSQNIFKKQVTHHTLKFLDAFIFGCTNNQWK
jgi:hypothetical protein